MSVPCFLSIPLAFARNSLRTYGLRVSLALNLSFQAQWIEVKTALATDNICGPRICSMYMCDDTAILK
eukprot:6172184-Pleurochrysis_carterae.AAC.2